MQQMTDSDDVIVNWRKPALFCKFLSELCLDHAEILPPDSYLEGVDANIFPFTD